MHMLPPILAITVHGHPLSHRVVRRASALAAMLETDLVIAHYSSDSTAPRSNADFPRDVIDNRLPERRVRTVSGFADDIAKWFADLIRDQHPCWVCAPKTGLATSPVLHLSPIKRLVEASPVPLWLVGTVEEPRPIILAAIDPTHGHDKPAQLDRQILELAIQLSGFFGAEVHVLHAVFAFDVPRSLLEELRTRREQWVRDVVEAYSIPPVCIHVPIGLAGIEIGRLSDELQPEVVVMGSVKRGIWKQITMGSTAREVVPNLTCDLLAVPPILPSS